MKSTVAVLVVLVSLSFANGDSGSFIVGGRDASIEDFPYKAGILNLGRSLCGGSIINSRSVLTVHLSFSLSRNCSFKIAYSRRHIAFLSTMPP